MDSTSITPGLRLGAVVLAAGASRRFGGANKLLTRFAGEPLLLRAVRPLVETGLADIVVVTGAEQAGCELALAELAVRFTHNTGWKRGMGGSIAAGVRALIPDLDGAFIVPGDMPFLTAAVLQDLAHAFARANRERIAYPVTSDGGQRNPVLWPRRFFAPLATLSGQEGAKRLLQARRHESVAVAIAEVAALADIDTPQDLEAARRLLKE